MNRWPGLLLNPAEQPASVTPAGGELGGGF